VGGGRRGRLVRAAGGRLFAGTPGEAGLARETGRHDFGGMTFEAIEAPY
jgi:hypothetical protein